MVQKEVYRRKLSREEASIGYLMILKDRLDFFPRVGEAFDLWFRDKSYRVQVDSEHCTCRGPDKPHEHYRISLDPLRGVLEVKKGIEMTIVKNQQKFVLTT